MTTPFGLALGGGAARAFAHLGVLQALEEAGLRPAWIGGTSMGAVVAACYALHGSAAAALDHIRRARIGVGRVLLDNVRPRGCERSYRAAFGDAEFADLQLPCCVCATDAAAGERAVLRDGPVWSAVMASAAIPPAFAPVWRDGRLLIDGGFTSIVPVRAVRELGAGYVVGVFVGFVGRDCDRGRPNRLSAVISACDAAARQANLPEIRQADFLLAPDVADTWAFAFHRLPELVARGYQAARHALPALQQTLRSPEPMPT